MSWQIQPTEFIRRPLPLSIAAERGSFLENAKSGERLIVTLYPTAPRMRGFLQDVIFDAVEQTLREQGAPAADRLLRSAFAESLSDALYRASLVGLSGIALEIQDLNAIVDTDNTLHPEDGQTLARWVAATEDNAVQLLLPPAVRALKIFPDPVPLSSILPISATLNLPAMIEYLPTHGAAATSESESEDSTPPSLFPPALEAFAADAQEETAPESNDDFASAFAAASDSRDEMPSADDLDAGWLPAALAAPLMPPQLVTDTTESNVSSDQAQLDAATTDAASDKRLDDGEALPAILDAAPATAPVELVVSPSTLLRASPVELVVSPVEPPPPPARKTIAAETFGWLRELEATRGPKPLSAIERLFQTAYLPLQRAVNLGEAPENAPAMLEEWSTSFAKSYKEAFEALKLRGRRPLMVMDLPEAAHRLARLHGVRHVQLLLVDGMSYDLGQRINQRLHTVLAQKAACAEKLMLWSGLPVTTATQLELIGRGQNALREFTGEIDEEVVVNRGRTANTIRRIRTGHRELFKLDLVEAMLVGMGDKIETRLEELVDAVTPVIATHIAQQSTGTLVMVFGDHGFVFETDAQGNTLRVAEPTGRVEEVLTPAFAWLSGAVH
ncbi:MAG TPA: hypothetical protein VHO25_16075 [Polyangiaceae bacterium]|nr:hypothetical protein [Polyangiaceae bacterium]